MHIYMVFLYRYKFHEILLSGFRGVALTNCFRVSFILAKFLSSKRRNSEKNKLNQNFLWICTSTWYVL